MQLEYQLDMRTGEYVCGTCQRRFPTHYFLRDHSNRREFGRRLVSGQNNFFRHVEACQLKRLATVAREVEAAR